MYWSTKQRSQKEKFFKTQPLCTGNILLFPVSFVLKRCIEKSLQYFRADSIPLDGILENKKHMLQQFILQKLSNISLPEVFWAVGYDVESTIFDSIYLVHSQYLFTEGDWKSFCIILDCLLQFRLQDFDFFFQLASGGLCEKKTTT